MGTTLIKDTLLTVTMDDEIGDIKNSWVFVKDGKISDIDLAENATPADKISEEMIKRSENKKSGSE